MLLSSVGGPIAYGLMGVFVSTMIVYLKEEENMNKHEKQTKATSQICFFGEIVVHATFLS